MSSLESSEAGRRFNARQASTVERLLDAALDEVRAVGLEAMTVRTVAARAEVAPATAYTYFASKQHLVAEVFWRELQRLPATTQGATRLDRVQGLFSDLVALLVAEPQLASATTVALLAPDPNVAQLRLRVGGEISSRLGAALDDDHGLTEALTVAWSGSLLQAGLGYQTYPEMGQQLTRIATLILAEGSRS